MNLTPPAPETNALPHDQLAGNLKNLQFKFVCRLHDFNQDRQLDGNELYVALRESTTHTSEEMADLNPQDIEDYFAGKNNLLQNAE